MQNIAKLLVGLCLLSVNARGAVRLPPIFGNNMVLQSDERVPVWGTAVPQEQVTVTFNQQTVSALADASGKWRVELAPMEVGTTGEMTVSGTNKLRVNNVLVGDVWLASGQSNMSFIMANSAFAAEDIPKASDPQLRFFIVGHAATLVPQEEEWGHWEVCTPQNIRTSSAVAYYFGKNLREDVGRPLGLIESDLGGSFAEQWVSQRSLEADPALSGYVEMRDKASQNPAISGGEVISENEWANNPQLFRFAHTVPTTLYNGMIWPLVGYGLRGIIWYQGEANVGRAELYQHLFPRLIEGWRMDWGKPLPFIFVQLASYGYRSETPEGSMKAALREAQAKALVLPSTAMAVAIDLGDPLDGRPAKGPPPNLHPTDKRNVGRRLALQAERLVYGKKIVAWGPRYDRVQVEGHAIRVSFEDTGGGLAIGAPPPNKPGEEPTLPASSLKGFAIAGSDAHFVWADARIEDKSVVVSSPEVPNPVAVRYGWADYSDGNLYNKEELPATPFRTDAWPVQ